MTEKHITNRFPGKLRPLMWRVAAALTALSAQAHAVPGNQFAATPLYLQNEITVTGAPGVKPNVMLLLDDSGSMKWIPSARVDPRTIYEQSRLVIMKRAMTQILDKYQDKFNWGIQTLNNNNYVGVATNAKDFTMPWYQIKDQINSITAFNATPSTRRYYEVSEWVRKSIRYRCQKSYIVLMSDGDANSTYEGSLLWDTDSRTGQFLRPQQIISYWAWGNPDGNNFINDPYFGYRAGYPKKDLVWGRGYSAMHLPDGWATDVWDPVFDRGDGLGWFSHKMAEEDIRTEAGARAGGQYAATDEFGKSWDGDPQDPRDPQNPNDSKYKKQLVETFTVGFGKDLSKEGLEYLRKGASSDSNFFDAGDGASLTAAFNNIFEKIELGTTNQAVQTTGSTAPAATSSGIPDLAAVVQLDTGSWSSQLRFYQINKDGSVNQNAYTQPTFANRKTLIHTGGKVYDADKIGGDTNNATFGISGGSPADNKEWQDVLMPWTMRSADDAKLKSTAASRAYSQPYRVREEGQRDLGDILGGSVAAIGEKTNGRQQFMVAAANDGMVHVFKNDGSPYDLKMSYIPADMEREDDSGNASNLGKFLKDLAHDSYGKTAPHRYMVNGGFVLRQSPLSADRSRRTFMFGAMGQGGRGAYALDIGAVNQDSSNWAQNVPLFETEKGENNKLGYTVGSAQIGRVSVKRDATPVSIEENVRYAGFLGSGYRVQDATDAANETALYVYEMLGEEAGNGSRKGQPAGTRGEVLAKITVSDGVGGLSTPTLVDTDFDGIVDIAYAGDRGGNMYRFDLRGETPSKWSYSKIYQGIATQPITAAPAVSRRSANKYVVIFGTGSDIYQSDLNNTDQQSVYGIYDDVEKEAVLAQNSELQSQTMNQQGEYIYLSDEKVDGDEKGWKIDLAAGGERVVVKPTMILRTAVITTRKYESKVTNTTSNGDKCLPESSSSQTASTTSIIGVNAENGGAIGMRGARFTPDVSLRTINGTSAYANGLKQEGIVSFTFLNGAKLNDSPVTADGDSGGSGTDDDLTGANGAPNNKCFPSGSTRSLLLNNLNNLEVKGRSCGLRRISWREIF